MTATLARTYTRLRPPRIGPGMTDTSTLPDQAGGSWPLVQQEPTTAGSPILTLTEAANYLRISPQTLKNWRATGRPSPTALRLGAAVRFHIEDLELWARNQREVRRG